MYVVEYMLAGVMTVGTIIMVVCWYQVNKAIKEYRECEENFSRNEKEFEKALQEYERLLNEAGDE